MSVNNHLLGNNPLWTGKTTTIPYTALGAPGTHTISSFTLYLGADTAGQARSMIVSNHGPVNLFVGTGGAVGGILLQPGAALTVGVGAGATVTVYDSVGTGVFSTVLFE